MNLDRVASIMGQLHDLRAATLMADTIPGHYRIHPDDVEAIANNTFGATVPIQMIFGIPVVPDSNVDHGQPEITMRCRP